MSQKLSRRDFLKASALAATVTVVSGCTINLQQTEYLESYVTPPEEGLPGENLWYATACRQCPAGCGIIVRVSNGRARKVEGNPLHPLNRGKLCARGQAVLQELYNPDRLRNAVRQTGGRGSLQFAPIYWEEALDVVGDAIARAEPGSVAFFGGNLSSHLYFVASRFLQALESPAPFVYTLGDELDGGGLLVRTAEQLFGKGSLPVFDIANAEIVFSFGANFLETWLSPVSYSRAYGRMRRGKLGKRGYLVQFEPRCSSTAACADEWIRTRPGTEGLVALALGRLLTELGLAREDHNGVYDQVDVAAIADASGVSLESLERLARAFGSAASAVAIPGGSLTAQQNAAASIAAVQGLNLIMGRMGQPGGVFLAPRFREEEFAPPSVSTFADVKALTQAMIAGRIKVLLVHGANPAFDLPPDSRFREALDGVPLVVSFSSDVDETAAQSDLVLPDHTNLEGWGYHVASGDRRIVSGQQPVMRPLYDTRSTVDVLLALGHRYGGRFAELLPWRNEVEFLRDAVSALRPEGTPANAFWSIWRQRGGWWAEEAEWEAPSMDTASPATWAPAFPTFEADPAEYPLHILVYPSVTLHDGRGANKAWLQETPDPMTTVSWQTWVEVHPTTARALGVRDDDIVRVISSAGEIEAIVYLYPGIAEDVVAIPAGQGHENYGRFAIGRGGNPVKLLLPPSVGEVDNLAVSATRVRIATTGRSRKLARLESGEGVEYLRAKHIVD